MWGGVAVVWELKWLPIFSTNFDTFRRKYAPHVDIFRHFKWYIIQIMLHSFVEFCRFLIHWCSYTQFDIFPFYSTFCNTIRHGLTFIDIIWLYATIKDINQQYPSIFVIIRHLSIIILHYSSPFVTIRQYSTRFYIIRHTISVPTLTRQKTTLSVKIRHDMTLIDLIRHSLP